MTINKEEFQPSVEENQASVEARLQRISDLISNHNKTETETNDLRDLLARQRQYEAIAHREEFKLEPLTPGERNELSGLRIMHHANALHSRVDAKRMVELSRRAEKETK
jgi:hypothetical protein